MRVAVIGAGIGGLTAAIGLRGAGADVIVYERSPKPQASGSGLSIFGNGWSALDAIGAGEVVRGIAATDIATLTAGQRTPDGRWLATTSPAAVAELRILHRAELHEVLTAQLPPESVCYGATATVPTEQGDLLSVDVGQGTSVRERYDVIVAADGIRSQVRSSWPDDPGVRYAGYSTWRGITSHPVHLSGAAGETWGRGHRFGYAPLRDGRVYWFAVASMPATAQIRDELAHVRTLFATWHPPIGDLLEATPPGTVFRLPIEDLAKPLPTFRRGRCVLLGDAAHAMTPDLGQGANQALEDAAVLAHRLRAVAADPDPDPATLDLALDSYDRARRARTQPIAARARKVGQVAQAGGRLAVAVRNGALRALPSSFADTQLTRLQSWRPA